MGIPGLYRNIIRNYTGIHYYSDEQNIAHLYIDFNPIIYNCYEDIIETKIDFLEETLIQRIIEKLMDMIYNVVYIKFNKL